MLITFFQQFGNLFSKLMQLYELICLYILRILIFVVDSVLGRKIKND